MQPINNQFKVFWSKYETKIIICLGMILIVIVSFEFGLMQGKKLQSSPLIIEKVGQTQDLSSQGCSVSLPEAQNLTPETKKSTIIISDQVKNSVAPVGLNCAYVGSKNSDKFYPPTCSYAKRIKPENIVCFTTAQEAISQGRTESTGCK